jgi:hypothetical protein
MMERFDPAYSCVLIYAFAIFDEKHMGCLKIGKATIKLKDEQEYGSLFIHRCSIELPRKGLTHILRLQGLPTRYYIQN